MRLLITLSIFLFLSISVLAQPGANDPTFNPFDNGTYGDGSGFDASAGVISIQADGKIIAAGSFNYYNGTARNFIARINTNGSNDATFNIGSGFSHSVKSTIIQPDGKILVGGDFYVFNGVNKKYIARLNSNGTADATFNIGTGFNAYVSEMALQQDGKIIASGLFSQYNGTAVNRLVRLNSNGTLDATFSAGTGATGGGVYSIAIQTDGKILLAGSFSHYNGTAVNHLVRLNSNGTIDPSFTMGVGPGSGDIASIYIQSDGKLLVGGDFYTWNGTPMNRIARLNPDGSLDIGFNIGTGFDGVAVSKMAIQPDGKIVIGGSFNGYNGALFNDIIRLNSDGTLDSTFNPGTGFVGTVGDIRLQTDGRIVTGGSFDSFDGNSRFNIARLNTNGSLDPTFIPNSGSNGQINSTAIQPDGKILIGGSFTTFNGKTINRIARLHPDGTLDTTFNPGTGFNSTVYTVELLPDGKVIVGGYFDFFNDIAVDQIVRLNSDGTIDNTFSTTGSGVNNIVTTTSVQPDGKIIIGGWFTSVSGTSKNRIARLNANGSLDPSFNPGTGFDSWVYGTKLQVDGKVVVTGYFISFNGIDRHHIARLNTNGSLDTSFHVIYVNEDAVLSTSIQTDGKIVVGGDFTFYNGSRNRIARLNTDGSIDPTFIIGTGFNNTVYTSVIQSDGKIILGGDFTAYNGTSIKRIARLNTDGSLDLTFNPGLGFNDWVFSTALQADGKLIAAGIFTPFNGIPRNRIARLFTTCPTISPGTVVSHLTCFGDVNGAINLTPSGGTPPYTFNWGSGITTEDRIGLAAGTYSVTVSDAVGCSTVFNATVTQPDILADSSAITHVSCFGDANGAIDIIPSGGTLPYTFTWTDGPTTEDRTDLDVGTYSITLSDANGCTTNYSITITQPAAALLATTSITHIACFGGATGAIDLTLSGGTAPYTFDWGTGIATEDRSNLSMGTYSVTVSDANACSTTASATLTQAFSTISAVSNVTNVSCFGGSNATIDLTPSGGTLPYTFDWGNSVTTEDRTGLVAGTYIVTITDVNGCAMTSVTVTQPATALSASTSVTNVGCFGSSDGAIDLIPAGGTFPYMFDWGNSMNLEDRSGLAAGTYPVTIADSNGCSTTISPSVTEPAAITSSFSTTTCNTYSWNNQTYTTSGSYTQVLTNSTGCDSTVTLTLTINNATSASMTQTACNSFTLNGQTYTASGTYLQNLTNAAGCDSILTLNLTITNATAGSITQTACDSYMLNGQTYTASGTYLQNLTNAAGCDSILTLNLTITNATAGSITQTACDSYMLNGQTYTASGTYTQNLTNVAGCDSTLTLNLTILNSTTNSMTATACDTFTLNGQTYTASGTYTQNLTNAAGCDSTVMLNLTITNGTTGSVSQTACNSITLNGQTYVTSGTYIQHLTNAAGCDSTLTLNLTISTPEMTAVDNNDGTITASSANGYQWIDCATGNGILGANSQTFTATLNGSYAVAGTMNSGCSDTSACVTINYLRVAEQSLSAITIEPNPTQDAVTVQFDGVDVILMIIDSQGKLLTSQSIISGDRISLKNYADGIYFFKFVTAKSVMTKRIVKN